MGFAENLPWYPDKEGFPSHTLRSVATLVWYFALIAYTALFIYTTFELVVNFKSRVRRTDTSSYESTLPIVSLDICEDMRANLTSVLDELDVYVRAWKGHVSTDFMNCIPDKRASMYKNARYYHGCEAMPTQTDKCTLKPIYEYGIEPSTREVQADVRVLREVDKNRFRCRRFGMDSNISVGEDCVMEVTVSVGLTAMTFGHSKELKTRLSRDGMIKGLKFRWSSRNISAMNSTFDPEPLRQIYIPAYDSKQVRQINARGYHRQLLWENAFGFESENHMTFHPTYFRSQPMEENDCPGNKPGRAVFKLPISDFNVHKTVWEDQRLTHLNAYVMGLIVYSAFFRWLMNGFFMKANTAEMTYRFPIIGRIAQKIANGEMCGVLSSLIATGADKEAEEEEEEAASETTPLQPQRD